jgi:prepilin-type N-terminal cleavage/methylation domain-containing protein
MRTTKSYHTPADTGRAGLPADRPRAGGRHTAGFTLIELMVVMCIMGIIMAIGVPFAYRVLHKETLGQTVSDVIEVCSHARARAILQSHMTEVLFNVRERTLSVSGGGASSVAESGAAVAATGQVPAGSGLSTRIPGDIQIDMLDVNLTEYKDSELVVPIRFFPNGTCDEFTLILHGDKGQYRKISLEYTTGLADVESDYTKFK